MIVVSIVNFPVDHLVVTNVAAALHKTVADLHTGHELKFVIFGTGKAVDKTGKVVSMPNLPCLVNVEMPLDIPSVTKWKIVGLINQFLFMHNMVENSQIFVTDAATLVADNGALVQTSVLRKV